MQVEMHKLSKLSSKAYFIIFLKQMFILYFFDLLLLYYFLLSQIFPFLPSCPQNLAILSKTMFNACLTAYRSNLPFLEQNSTQLEFDFNKSVSEPEYIFTFHKWLYPLLWLQNPQLNISYVGFCFNKWMQLKLYYISRVELAVSGPTPYLGFKFMN